MHKNNYCVIMAGGIGARFWPMSRTTRPKQFIDILGTGETLIQRTFRRFERICPKENIFIVTNEIYANQVRHQLPDLPVNNILLEPAMRNTAPCIAYANFKIQSINPDANIVVAPSDHLIMDEELFAVNINAALKAAAENPWLITLGIKPTRPDTGYGYIQFDDSIKDSGNHQLRKVKTFTEKPNHELAEKFLASGDFLWNAGIFIWSLKTINKAFEEYLDDINDLFKEGIGVYNTEGEKTFINEIYAGCRKISIDYGIMEKATNVYVLSADFDWSDLGTWGSLYDTREKDEYKNAVVGDDVMLYNTSNCIINMPKGKLVVLQGLDNYIVVEEDNALLICRKDDEQEIRKFVGDIKTKKGEKFI
ncbi:MAG: mannose-1-phosphate guanylyltransferase [Bacteroidales bacterium]|nr:mannose-1-phosphate guanylyltransferase [Bacteroidales bacterium]